MQYANFGNTGLIVSRFALGAMTFGQGTLVGDLKTTIDQKTADQLVGMALDAGVNIFDTADMYTGGQSEMMLGKALQGKRDDSVISTKCGFRSGEPVTSSGLSYRYVLTAVEASLKRLNTDYIDLFLLHIPDHFTPLEETARALDDIVRKGWVRYVGYCNYPAWKAQKLIDIQISNSLARCIAVQMYYSLLGRDIEHDVVPFLEDNGLGLMVWSPLASGFLSGKYTRNEPVPPDSRRAKFNFPPIDVEKGYAAVEKMKEIAEHYETSVPHVALAWLLAKPFISTVILGANSVEQLNDNLGAADVVLAEEDVKILDDLTATAVPYPAWMQGMGIDQKVRQALEGEQG